MTKKLSNKKGFTLAELLVVVAIIAVLVAVSIPIFSAQTKKANLATNQANARAAKAAAVSEVLGGGFTSAKPVYEYDITTGTGAWVEKATYSDKVGDTTANVDISSWTVDTVVKSDIKLGTKTFKKWDVVFVTTGTGSAITTDGTVSAFQVNSAQ